MFYLKKIACSSGSLIMDPYKIILFIITICTKRSCLSWLYAKDVNISSKNIKKT